MALTTCPECQGKVSMSAPRCPHCGHPLPAASLASGGAAPVGWAAASPPWPGGLGPPVAAMEEVLWTGTPSTRILWVEALKTSSFAALVISATALGYRPLLRALAKFSDSSADLVTEYRPGFRLAAILFVVTVVGMRSFRLAWRGLVLRHHRYRLSNQRLTIETGVVSKTLNEIDVRAIEDIKLSQSATERLLGLGRIEIVSSDLGGAVTSRGQMKSVFTLIGIANPRAVRETIRGAAYQATRNQLFLRST